MAASGSAKGSNSKVIMSRLASTRFEARPRISMKERAEWPDRMIFSVRNEVNWCHGSCMCRPYGERKTARNLGASQKDIGVEWWNESQLYVRDKFSRSGYFPSTGSDEKKSSSGKLSSTFCHYCDNAPALLISEHKSIQSLFKQWPSQW
jgi:hypothetical protein